MIEIREEISRRLVDLISRKEPVGWYVIEHSFTLQRSNFPDGTNVMTYLDELEAKGEIEKDGDGNYLRAKRA
ncbi:hypothetical protein [uncultured Roseobacter sp.]|uniref:hypothetical protein n=1 Tax=uncultured Roseobacter sp. TaxID=114847 RepID=UPI002628E687|nr:hypothetical protein [uncultured Roseobacter sp.]